MQEEAEEAGGYPIAVLRARLELKRWLRDARGIPLAVVPDEPDLDCAPMPIYEAGRMTTPIEEARFERWMLSRFDLCRDVAEFAVFSLAIRAGALSEGAPPPPKAATPAAEPKRAAAPVAPTPEAGPAELEPAPEQGGSAMGPMLVIGAVLAIVLLLAVVAAVVLFVL